jgi:hypothetical protein
MKKLSLLFFCASLYLSSQAQKIYWTDQTNSRIISADLTASGVGSSTVFRSGISDPRYLEADLNSNTLYYQEGYYLIQSANLSTGAFLSTVLQAGGAFDELGDMSWTSNDQGLIVCNSPEVQELRFVPFDNNDGGNDFTVDTSPYDNSDISSVAINDDDGYVYMTYREDGNLYRKAYPSGPMEYLTVYLEPRQITLDRYTYNHLYIVANYGVGVGIFRYTLSNGQSELVRDLGNVDVVDLQVYSQFNKVYYSVRNSGIYSLKTDVLPSTAPNLEASLGAIGDIFFTITPDYVAPIFTGLSPADNATNVSTGPTLTMTFDENLKISTTAGTANETGIRIMNADNTQRQIIDRSSSNVSIANNVVTISGISSLNVSSSYYVLIGAKVFSDFSSNNFIGITLSTGWNFTTVPGVSITAPNDIACVGSYKSYPNIVITEAGSGNFKTGTQTLIFSFSSAGYGFENGTGLVTGSGADLTINSFAVTSTTITINYTVSATAAIDAITISGLKLNSTTNTNPAATIYRSGGTGVVDGLVLNTVIGNVTTQDQPTAPSVTYPQGSTLCLNENADAINVNSTGTSVTWYTANNLLPASKINALDGNNQVTGSELNISTTTPGIINRYVRRTVTGCVSLAAQVDITVVNPPQSITTSSSPQTFCSGADGIASVTGVDGGGTSGYTFSWLDESMNPIGFSGPSITDMPFGTYYAVVENASGCAAAPVAIIIQDQRSYPVSNLVSDPNTHCTTPNGTITATLENQIGPISDYTFTWRNGPDPDSPPIGSSTTNVITGLPGGNYGLTTRHNPSQCEIFFGASVLDQMTPPEIFPPSGIVCETTPGSGTSSVVFSTFDATVTGGNADLVVTWYNASSNPVSSATVANAETFSYIATSNTSGCSAEGALQFSVTSQPTPANANTDQDVCGTSTLLAANTATVGTGAWSIVSGVGGTFANTANPATSFTGSPNTTYILQWSIENGSVCPISTDNVSISFTAVPTTANAGTDQNICNGPATLAGNTPSIGTGAWSIVSGANGVIANPSSPTSGFSGIAGNNYVLRWTISNGTCPTSSDDMSVALIASPTAANAGTDQNFCGTTVTLNANTPTIGAGKWTKVSGTGGAFALDTNPTSSFTGTAGITYVLRWTTTNTPCPNSTDDVTITLSGAPTASLAGSDQNICGTTATLSANNPTVGTGAWTVVSGANGSFANPASPSSTFTGTAGTTYNLRWTTSNGNCAPSADDVVISLVANPTVANANIDQNICSTSTTLNANAPVRGIGEWSVVSGVGGAINAINSPSSSFTGTAGSTYVLRWSITNGICPPSTDDVSIKLISPPTTALAGNDQAKCGTSTDLTGNTPSVGTGQWSIVSGASGSIANPALPVTGFQGAAGNTYVLRWTIAQIGCPSSTDDVSVQLKSLPLGSGSITPLTALCTEEETTLTVSGISNVTNYEWIVPAGVSIVSQSGESIVIQALNGTGGTVSVTPQNDCGNGTLVNGSITVLPLPSADIILPATPFPLDNVGFSFTSDASFENVLWSFGDGGTSSEQSPQHAFASPGEYEISLLIKPVSGCENTVTESLTVSDEPTLSDHAIKNVITANGDDQNKFLFIENLDRHPDNEVRFLDRWGVEIIKIKNYQNDWEAKGKDGQFLPAGQYICIVKLVDSGKVISRTVSIIKGR